MSELSFDSQNEDKYNSSYDIKSSPFATDSGFDLMYYYRLLLRNLWKVAFFSIIVGIFSVLYAFSLPPIYFSKTTLLIENQQPKLLSFQDVYQADTRDRQYLGTQLQILKSRSIASRVVDKLKESNPSLFSIDEEDSNKTSMFDSLLKLFATPVSETVEETNANEEGAITVNEELIGNVSATSEEVSNLGEEQYLTPEDNLKELEFRNRMINMVKRVVDIRPIYGTKLVTIEFSATDPQVAADIANTFADVYIESHLEAKLQVTQKASEWLSERLGDLRQKLRASELELQEFRERERLVDTGDAGSIDVAELEQLTGSLVEATSAKNEAAAIYKQMANRNLPIDQLLALPTVNSNTVVQTLIENRAEAKRLVAELSKRYREKHPKMIAALADVGQIEQELREQVSNVALGVEANYLASKDSEKAIKTQITEVKSRLQNVNRKAFVLRELEREVEANRQVYDVFLNRGKEADESRNLEAVNARVIDEAIPAEYPEKPRKKRIVMFAVLFSGVFAVGIILLLDWLDNTIKTPEDVEERLGVPLLGHLPLDKTNKDDAPFLGFLSEDNWHFAESVRTMRTSFILSGLDKPAKITVITSSVPNEGKSTVSLCLSHALGQMEKVLLIDADMRKSSIGKALDISLLTPGLSNLIAGTAELSECITRIPNSEVHVITAGVVLGNPLDLIAGDNFVNVLDMLREKYDRIIIDSAPIQAVSDSIVIATHADALVYVVKSDGSPTPVIKRGLRRLSETNARFSGVVLNQVDIDKMKKQSGYESDYYDNYGYAYGDTGEKSDA